MGFACDITAVEAARTGLQATIAYRAPIAAPISRYPLCRARRFCGLRLRTKQETEIVRASPF
jgi:hypothetical protein